MRRGRRLARDEVSPHEVKNAAAARGDEATQLCALCQQRLGEALVEHPLESERRRWAEATLPDRLPLTLAGGSATESRRLAQQRREEGEGAARPQEARDGVSRQRHG